MFKLSEITQALTGRRIPSMDMEFTEASTDSRAIRPGMLFLAIPGENTDGHHYIDAAFQAGARAALIEHEISGDYAIIDLRSGLDFPETIPVPEDHPFCILTDNTVEALQKIAAFHRRQLPEMRVIGITGSVGKTSTKEVMYEVFSRHCKTLKSLGNMNNEIGLPMTLLCAEADTELAILEMGFYVRGDIDLLCRISDPQVGVVTNIGMVHASRAGSMDAIAEGKSELVQALSAEGTAILNYDDPYVRPMAEKTSAHIFTYGLDSAADLSASEIKSYGLNGIEACLTYRGEKHSAKIPLIGKHSVYTALRAAAAALVCGLSWEEILCGLQNCKNQLRMAVEHTREGALVIDDTYNASPESSLAALNLLDEMEGTKIAVLGEMKELGQYEVSGHEMVGLRAAEICDEIIAIGPATKHLYRAALSAHFPDDKAHWFETVPEAIPWLTRQPWKAGDVLLVKGSRSMRMEQIIDALEAKA